MKISHKLWLIVALMVVALTVLTVSANHKESEARTAGNDMQRQAETVMLLNNISAQIQSMLLAAMDSIVDHDSGKVDETLIAEVEAGITSVAESVEKLSTADADDAKHYAELLSQTKAIHHTITDELFPAINNRASAAVMADLDDRIDAAGQTLRQALTEKRDTHYTDFLEIRSATDRDMQAAMQFNWVICGVAILTALIAAALIIRSITRPIASLTHDIHAIASGNADITITSLKRRDELGIIGRALETLRLKAEESFRLKRMVDEMPINVITADIHDDFKITYANNTTIKTMQTLRQYLPISGEALLGQSIDIFHKDPQRIRVLLSNRANLPHQAKIKIGSETLDLKVSAVTNQKGEYVAAMLVWSVVTHHQKLADEFQGSIGAMSEQLGSSAVAMQERATSLHSAIEELSVAALEISKRVHDSLDIVRQAVETGDNASSMTTQLSQSAERISNVVTLIRSIAEKTNLLALNATIESARAGDAGKGFAVVANEVKALASQTANAIGEISKQIMDMQTAAQSTAEAIGHMSEIVKNVNIISTTIAATVEEQQAATTEIARNISGNHNSLHGMETLTIMGMATQLTDVSNHLKTQCEGFLQKVRAM